MRATKSFSPREAPSRRESFTAPGGYPQRLGHDAVAVTEAGLSGEPDENVRAFAIESGRILLTLDADFGNILRFPPAGTPGVIRLRIHPPTEGAIREQISKTMEVLKDTPLTGCLAVSHGNVIRIRS